MFYGNSSVTTDQSNKNGVWDSNYKGVWHFNQTPSGSGSELDSTSDGYNGTPASSGITLSSDGIAGSSLEFDGVSNGNGVTLSSSVPGGPPLTVSIWIKTNGLNATAQSAIVQKLSWATTGWSMADNGQYSSQVFFESLPNYSTQVAFSRASVNDGNWHYLVGTIDSSRHLDFYLDGSLYGTVTPSSIATDTSDPMTVGGFGGSSGGGLLTETRISNAVRSADWIATEYNNQSSPSTFYSIDSADWSNGYSFSRAITISHTKVPNTDQTNFPVLISGTYSYLATTSNGGNVTNSSGYDIIFTSDAGGTSPLPFEKETYNPSTGAMIYWVKVSTLSHTTDTVIYVFYGNSAVTTDQSNKTGVWDDSYKGVWHLSNGTTLSGSDSTANGYTLTNNNSTAAVSGEIDGAATFNGTNNYLSNSSLSIPAGSAITVSFWNYVPSSTLQNESGFSVGNNDNPNRIQAHDPWSDQTLYWDYGSWTGGGRVSTSYSSHLDAWTYVVLEYNPAGTVHSIYLNGSSAASSSSSNVPTSAQTGVYLGGWPAASLYEKGNLDEFRISTTVRSADRVASEYNNQSSPSTFYSLGSAVSSPNISSLSPTSGASGVSITITGTNFGSTQGSSTVSFNGSAATPTSWSATNIVVPVPVGASSGNVTVFVSGLASNGSTFAVTSPSISSLSPSSGPVGTSVTILGFNFGGTQGSSTLTFNGAAATPTSWGATSIVVPVPYGAASGVVVVSVSSTASNGMSFTVALPTISSLSPSSGAVGTSVTIIGSNFGATQGSSTVTFGGTATTPTSWSATSIVVPAPASAGAVSVVVSASGETSNGSTFTIVPVISNISATTGSTGGQVGIFGSGFGASQGSSHVTLNGTNMTVDSWTSTSIEFTIPTGATSGQLLVSVGTGNNSNSIYFSVTANPLPSSWLDQDIGSVPVIGSATYTSGTFTVEGSGNAISGGTLDELHFAYEPLSGDGTIIGRLVSQSGYYPVAGVMIRESLAANSTYAFAYYAPSSSYAFEFGDRSSTGGGLSNQTGSLVSLPEWVKLVRSGNSFTVFESPDRVTWTQVGSAVTVTMATNVYIGLAVDGGSSSLATAPFDNVSINSSSVPAPVITSLSATTGPIGSQVVVSGSSFGTAQGSSLVVLNDQPTIINSWSDTSITITIPTGATSGLMSVLVGPTMNQSNPITFTVTSQPLPSGWLDDDIGNVGATGSAGYGGGTFTVNGAGVMSTSTDAFHFVYQPLSGDGTIVARVVSTPYNEYALVMIRESLALNSTYAATYYTPYQFHMLYRTSTGGSASVQNGGSSANPPYWLKLTRSGNSFSSYWSIDGVSWTQVGSSETISMATDVYIGLAVDSGTTGTLQTTTFDNVSVSSSANPAPVISSVSATTGSIGSSITITGTSFGTSQGSSLVALNAAPMTVTSWSNTSITITIASGASSGYLVVSVAPSMNNSNPVYFTVTANPLPSGWLDQDIGSPGATGSAGYASGTFTLNGAGVMSSTTDAFHFAYETLSGDGTIVARVVNTPNTGYAAVMIRETTNSNSTFASTYYSPNQFHMQYRSSTGGTATGQNGGSLSNLPYWLKLTRIGSSFTSYGSQDGTYWTQIGSSETISMATGVYIGLAVDSSTSGTLQTSTFDNVTITSGTPYATPEITGITPTSGGIGQSVTINGSGFGATQGSSSSQFNGASATSITSWSDTQIVAIVPSGASTGPVTVIENGIGSNRNYAFTLYNPVISSLAPPSGPVGGTIAISGSGFGSSYTGNTVKFNGVTADINTMDWTDTNIVAYVPSGATSGPATVTVGGVTSNSVTFTVSGGANVTGISPTSGPIGTSMVITGTGFGSTQSDSTLSFWGGTTPTITSWSDTSISTTVPSGTVSGPVSVTVAGETSTGPVFTLTSGATVTDSLGNSTTYAGGIVGGQWVATDSDGSGCSTCTVRGVIHNTFDSRGNILSRTDSLGNVTTNTYDSSNNLLTQTVPIDSTHSATTTYTYNSLGEVLTVTDPLGNVTTNAYDSHGNLTSVTSPAPGGGPSASVTHFAYNSLGELTSITDPLGHVTTMTYTTAGLVYTITDAQSNVTTYAYDSHGNRTSVTDATSHTTNFAYDSGDRLTTITYPDSTTSTFTYDSRGRRTSSTDQNGKTTTYAYDTADRLTSVTDAASHVTYYAYDTEDNLTSIEDANSNTTAFTYDAYGRVTNTNFPSSISETYAYDANNNLTSKTDRKSQTITYLYDAMNRLTSKTYPDSTAVDYVYDLVGKITQVNDPTGTYAFAYDNIGRLIGTTTSYNFLTGRNFTNAYTYDAASNRTGFTDPESGSTTYSYDTLNRLTSLAPPSAFGSGSFGFSYDTLGRRTQMTRPNSVATNYTYDNLSRLTSVLHQLSGSTIDGEGYTLDSAGNRTAKVDHLAAVTSNYTYDAIYQLTQATQGGSTTESYTYDAVGNRTASMGVSSYTTNASNEMTANSNASYTYDSNGNTLTKTVGSNTTSYTWDYENRLTSVTLPGSGGTVTFKYDPMGRRIEKATSSTTSIFAYDGENLIEETNSSGAVVARYTQTQNIDEPVAMLRSSTTSFYQADGLGSVTSLSNGAGALAQSYNFDSFGKTTPTGSLVNPFQYTGRELDSETGLYFYRARNYDPSGGRFISEDPIGFGGGDNFYRYADDNPVIYTDPFGFTCHCTYHQKTGAFECTSDDTGQPVVNANGYSGHGPGLNNPDLQGTKYYPGVPGSYGGPIPVGTYGIGPPTTKIGPVTIPLTPLPGTNTFGRNGFYIHGDNSAGNHSASEGCIVLPPDPRKKIAGCNGGTLQVVP